MVGLIGTSSGDERVLKSIIACLVSQLGGSVVLSGAEVFDDHSHELTIEVQRYPDRVILKSQEADF